MAINDGWDDAPVAGAVSSNEQPPQTQPAPAVDEGWDVAPVQVPQPSVAPQVVVSPVYGEQAPDQMEAGYQALANDPEEIEIAAQRQINRGLIPGRVPVEDEGWDVDAPVAVPGAVSPTSARSTFDDDESAQVEPFPVVAPQVVVPTPVQAPPVAPPVVEVPVQVPVQAPPAPVQRESVPTPVVEHVVTPGESLPLMGEQVPVAPPVSLPPVGTSVEEAPASVPGVPAWAAVTQDPQGEYNDGWDDAPVANPGARVPVAPVQGDPFIPAVVPSPEVPVSTPQEGLIPFGSAAGSAVPLPPAPAPVERKVAPVAVPVSPVAGDSIDDDPEEGFDDDSDVITPGHGAVIPPLPDIAATDDETAKKAPLKKKSKSKALGGIRLTARDMQIMAFLARYRTATVGQLARKFQTSETALRNRLPLLDKAGLITWAWAAQTKPKIWMITEQGLQTVNMSLTAPTVRWGQLRHTLGLVDLGTTFELAGEIVLTEREIRAAATRYTPTARLKTAIDLTRFQSGLEPVPIDGLDPTGAMKRVKDALVVPVPGRTIGHIPDMVLARQPFPNGSSGNVAVELELTRKGLTEWKTVLTAYKDSPAFAQVYYFVMSGEVQRGLLGVIKALGLEEKVFVEKFIPLDLTADPTVTGGGA